MIEPEVGKSYRMFVPHEPVPKSTMKPPRARTKQAREAVIQKEKRFAPLANTLNFQRLVADIARLSASIPQFHPDDPVAIGLVFYKGQHALGDLKNLEACIGDGLKHSGKLPDDRQIVSRLHSSIEYYGDERGRTGVDIELRIDDRVKDDQRLFDWLSRSKKRFAAYKEMRKL